ncbi:GFA family protein [Caldimonas brevitalea]|uniref:GFA family protein n=1 Tax=Caldimonas brevitalea TaxID=413882 RepID=UPI00063FEA23|nr:GFA family protein [Caldimonas brevitalea]
MELEGSCHCKAVRFRVQSSSPCPFMRCYCSICRKTAGGGGYAINLGADHRTLQVAGREHLSVYRARMPDGSTSSAERHFCSRCGSALWLYDPTWPDLVHPHASAIDTPLPEPPERTHMMLGSRASWAVPDLLPGDQQFDEYPDVSLAEWHARHGMA